jgi:hypothetical protein
MKISMVIAGLALLAPSASFAQQTHQSQSPADALGSCFVLKSTGQDRLTFMQWMLAALGSTPRLKDVVRVEPDKKDQLDRQVALVMTRLITVDCLAEAKAVAKDKQGDGFRIAGQSLGRMAVQELFGDPDSERALSGYASYLHEEDFERLAR